MSSPVQTKKITSYQDLLVWQKAISLVEEIYKIAPKLPLNEQYGLTSQLRRAAVSVPANIAEGFGRWHANEFTHFLLIANGSLKEVETHLIVATRLNLLKADDIKKAMHITTEISKMIFALRNKLSQRKLVLCLRLHLQRRTETRSQLFLRTTHYPPLTTHCHPFRVV
jgi:four helix bundle protein